MLFVVYCLHLSVGWRVCLQATETGPNSEKNVTNRQGLKNAVNSICLSSTWFGPTLTTMTRLFAGWPAILTKLSASLTDTLCRTSTTCFRVNCVVILFVALKLLSFFAVLFVACEEWSCILLGSLPGAPRAIVCILFSL